MGSFSSTVCNVLKINNIHQIEKSTVMDSKEYFCLNFNQSVSDE